MISILVEEKCEKVIDDMFGARNEHFASFFKIKKKKLFLGF